MRFGLREEFGRWFPALTCNGLRAFRCAAFQQLPSTRRAADEQQG